MCVAQVEAGGKGSPVLKHEPTDVLKANPDSPTPNKPSQILLSPEH